MRIWRIYLDFYANRITPISLKKKGLYQSAASDSFLSPQSHYCWCDWDKGELGREVRTGKDKHEWRKVQIMSTILKFQFTTFTWAPRFFPSGPAENTKHNRRPWWRYSSVPSVLFVYSREARGGWGCVQRTLFVYVVQMILASEAVGILSSPWRSCILFVVVVW